MTRGKIQPIPSPNTLAFVDNLLSGQPDWQETLCAQSDPDAFFPVKGGDAGGSAKVAKQICAGCADRIPCLQYALDHGERFGVWGGMSERDRRRLEKQAAA